MCVCVCVCVSSRHVYVYFIWRYLYTVDLFLMMHTDHCKVIQTYTTWAYCKRRHFCLFTTPFKYIYLPSWNSILHIFWKIWKIHSRFSLGIAMFMELYTNSQSLSSEWYINQRWKTTYFTVIASAYSWYNWPEAIYQRNMLIILQWA